jgi:hypothetical protein
MAKMIFTSNFDAVTMHIYKNDEVRDTESIHATKDDAIIAGAEILEGIAKDLREMANYDLNPCEFYINTDEGTLEYDDSKYRFSIYIYEG